MAMKSVNYSTGLLTLVATLWLSGCATKVAQPEQAEPESQDKISALLKPASDKPELQPTESYLPRQQKDPQGQWLAYEPQKNPYLVNKSQVNKGSVLLFIEAQQAWRAEDFATVEQKLGVIINNDKKLSGPWVMKARLALRNEKYNEAEQHLLQAISLNSNNVNAYTLLAQAQRLQGKYFHAQNTLAEALKLWPDFPEAHYNLAIIYDAYLNKEPQAQQHLEAFMFLEKDVEPKDFNWLQDIASRTGIRESQVGQLTNPSKFLQQAADTVAVEQ